MNMLEYQLLSRIDDIRDVLMDHANSKLRIIMDGALVKFGITISQSIMYVDQGYKYYEGNFRINNSTHYTFGIVHTSYSTLPYSQYKSSPKNDLVLVLHTYSKPNVWDTVQGPFWNWVIQILDDDTI